MLEEFTEMRVVVDSGGVYRDEGVVDAGGVYRDEDGCRCWRSIQR